METTELKKGMILRSSANRNYLYEVIRMKLNKLYCYSIHKATKLKARMKPIDINKSINLFSIVSSENSQQQKIL
jgi:hypothetical protein